MHHTGIGLRQPHYAQALEAPPALGFVEVHSENFFADGGAALATLDLFASDDVLARNRERAQWLAEAMAGIAADPRVSHVRQRGMIWAADIDPEAAGADFAARFHMAARQHGVMVRPIGNTQIGRAHV